MMMYEGFKVTLSNNSRVDRGRSKDQPFQINAFEASASNPLFVGWCSGKATMALSRSWKFIESTFLHEIRLRRVRRAVTRISRTYRADHRQIKKSFLQF